MNYVTPEILREVADTLTADDSPNDCKFICPTFSKVLRSKEFSSSDVYEYARPFLGKLLRDAGLDDLSGCLGYYSRPDFKPMPSLETLQSIRFMFLEFLALYLEGEE